MANINVRKQLEKISDDLDRVAHHVALYGGIDERDARGIDTVATSISEVGAMLASAARSQMGNRSADSLTMKVRKALGYSKP